jgi:molecular chaperone HtpG
MPEEGNPVAFQPYLGGFILETLTIGMYGESRNALREYIQNAFDSIQHAIRGLKLVAPGEGLITVAMGADSDSLVIRDNGAGLPAKTAASTLTSIGASAKDYRKEAGFRGIGRLAGIVFSDKVTFVTKAKGEALETRVVFDGHKMRAGMSPSKGGAQSAEALLSSCVKAYATETKDIAGHYFEVRLEGFQDPPEECISQPLMKAFISQVAPVPYSDSFPFRDKLKAQEEATGIVIEEVRVQLVDAAGAGEAITKPYTDLYDMEEGAAKVKLIDCETRSGTHWWAWVGKKAEPGSFTNERQMGLRVRLKNIQIDGVEVFRDVFRQQAKSSARFQDWFVGEIFVAQSALVPNARRDGFEENFAWRAMKKQLGDLAKDLGSEAHVISNAGQLTLDKLRQKVEEFGEEFSSLERNSFSSLDRTLKFAADITKVQKAIAKVSKDASLRTSAELQALSSELIDFKAHAIKRIGAEGGSVDAVEIRTTAREELLLELMDLFEGELAAPCLSAVRSILTEAYATTASP